MADQGVTFNLYAKDGASQTIKQVERSMEGLGKSAQVASTYIEQADAKAKTFGENLSALRPKGEAISVAFQGAAVAIGSVGAAFAAAASQSEALQGQLAGVADAGKGALRSLGDAIAASDSFQRALGALQDGFKGIGKTIDENRAVIDRLVKDALDPLASAAGLAVDSVAGLAMGVVLLDKVSRGYLQMVLGTVKILGGLVSTGIGAATGGAQGAFDASPLGGLQDIAAGAKSAWAGVQSADPTIEAINKLRLEVRAGLKAAASGTGRRVTSSGGGGSSQMSIDEILSPYRPAQVDWEDEPEMVLSGDVIGTAPAPGLSRGGQSAWSRFASQQAQESAQYGRESLAIRAQENAAIAQTVASMTSLAGHALLAGRSLSEIAAQLAPQLGSALGSSLGSMVGAASGIPGGAEVGKIFGNLVGDLAGSALGSLFGSSSRRSYTRQDPLPVAIVEDLAPRAPIIVYSSTPSANSAAATRAARAMVSTGLVVALPEAY